MAKQGSRSAVFDYTSFLIASCKKKWTVMEIVSSIAPVFSAAWNRNVEDAYEPEDRLWLQAFNVLSAGNSDVSNLIRLVKLAKNEEIEELRLMMPYELDANQLSLISQKTDTKIEQTGQDELTVSL